MEVHAQLIQLIIGYSLAGALVFTVVVTCLSLVGWIEFKKQSQQNKLFAVLILELVIISVGFFGGLLKYDPVSVEQKIREVEQHKTLKSGLNKFIFVTENFHEFLSNHWTTKTAMVQIATQYNEAISSLRENESSSLQLLQIDPDKNKVSQFEDVMELVKRIDKSLHGLNDQVEKVSILGVQEEIDPDRATTVANELRPLITELKAKSTKLLEN